MIVGAVVAAVALGATGGAVRVLRKSKNTVKSLPTAKVVRGQMVVSITESGELKAEEQEVVANPVRWSVVIKELAAEGTIVKEGELIIDMECDELADAIIDQELRRRSAADDYQTASNKLLVTRKTAAAKVEKATQAVQDAKDDLKKYQEGEWAVQQADAEGKILLANGKLALAQRKLDSMNNINTDPTLQNPYSKKEIDEAVLEVQRLELEQKKATAEKRILEDYTHKRTVREKQTGVSDAELDLETTELEAETDVRLAEAAADSTKIRLKMQEDRLKELQEDAGKLKVVAEKPGLVVYETRRRAWHRPITVAVGEKINASQQLMIIPNMKTLQVETRVYEAVREQVDAGLPALISLDARPGKTLRGEVTKVAPLPDSQNPWLSPGVKVYPAVVKFMNLDDVEGLKPGMSAQVEIILARLADVLNVPIAAVFSDGEETYCFRVTAAGGYERVPVTVGQSSETQVQILSGLAEGDTVLLTPPPGVPVGKKIKDTEETDETQPVPEEAPTTGPARGRGDRGPRGPEAPDATTRPARRRSGTAPEGGRRSGRGRQPRSTR